MKDTITISNEDWVKAMKATQKDKQKHVLKELKFDETSNKDGGIFSSSNNRQPKGLREKTIKDLREEAKKLGLSAGGSKIVIFNRIEEHKRTEKGEVAWRGGAECGAARRPPSSACRGTACTRRRRGTRRKRP